MIARLQAEKSKRAQARSEARREADIRLLAAGQADAVDFATAFDGWAAWLTEFHQLKGPLQGEVDVTDVLRAPRADAPKRYVADPDDGELRPVIPDVLEPQAVTIETNEAETQGAGWPPEIHTRHYIVSGGAVILTSATGKAAKEPNRHELRRGEKPAEVAREMWQKRLTRTGSSGPLKYPKIGYA
jgi:hypothetical protein